MTTDDIDLPEGAHCYEDSDELPDNIKKYWPQRHKIFSLYDQGIWLTNDAWFGVTPEPIANKIALHISQSCPPHKTVLIDAFCGAGGNTIAFALSGHFSQIFAIERDPATLACAKHNAAIYGVENKIWWIQGDCFEILKRRLKGFGSKAVVFASPPWGGPGYVDAEVFRLEGMQPYSLQTLYDTFTRFCGDVVLFLPRTSDLDEVAGMIEDDRGDRRGEVERVGKKTDVVHYCMHGSSKALCVYYGDFDLSKAITTAQHEEQFE